MTDYDATASINAPEVQTPDIDTGFEKFRSTLTGFVNDLKGVGDRFMGAQAKQAGAQAGENGTFKPLPELSPEASAYNAMGQQFEQSVARIQLQKSAQDLQQTLMQKTLESGQPLQPEDIRNFQNHFNDVAQNIIGSASPQSQPYIKNMAEYMNNQQSFKLQNTIDSQNKSIMTFGVLQNADNLNNQIAQALQTGDVNGAINFAWQSRQVYKNPGTIALLGGVTADRLNESNEKNLARTIGIQAANDPNSKPEDIEAIAKKFGLNDENTSLALTSYNSHVAQLNQASGITSGAVMQSLRATQRNMELGNIPSSETLYALTIQASKLRGGAGVQVNAMANALNLSANQIQALKYAPTETQNQEIQKLAHEALDTQDHVSALSATMTLKALENIRKTAQDDPATWALGSPAVQKVKAQVDTNLKATAASGYNMNPNALSLSVNQTILQTLRDNHLPLAVIPNVVAQNTVSSIAGSGNFSQGVQQLNKFLTQYQQDGTEAYAINDLIKNNLPVSYVIARNMNQNPLTQAKFAAAMDPNQFNPLKSTAVGTQKWHMIQNAVTDNSKDFISAFKNVAATNAPVARDQILNAASRYAAYLIDHGDQSDEIDAAKAAVKEIVNTQYNIKDNLMIPKPYDPNMVTAALDRQKNILMRYAMDPNTFKTASFKQQFAAASQSALADRFIFTDDERRAMFLQNVSQSHWALNANNNGFVLVSPSGIPLRESSNGLKYNYYLQEMLNDEPHAEALNKLLNESTPNGFSVGYTKTRKKSNVL